MHKLILSFTCFIDLQITSLIIFVSEDDLEGTNNSKKESVDGSLDSIDQLQQAKTAKAAKPVWQPPT